MELMLIFIFFTLLFFNSAHAACVPRNHPTSSPNPHAPPKIKPVSPSASASPLCPQAGSCPATTEEKVLVDAVLTGLPQASGNDNPEIKKICDDTDYTDVCQATLSRYNGPFDIPSVLGISMQAGFDFSKAAIDMADRLSTQSMMSPAQSALLKDCKDSYDDVLYDFQSAHDALPAKDVGTMNTMLSAAITSVGDCIDSYEGGESPVGTFSDKLTKMASNCLAIITQLK